VRASARDVPLESLERNDANVTRHRFFTEPSDEAAADNNADDYGIEEDRSNEVTAEVDWKRSSSKASSKGAFPPSIHTMLVVVTADVVAATAQLGEGGTAASTHNCDTSAACSSDPGNVGCHDSPLDNTAHGTLSAITEDLSITVAEPADT